MTKPLTRREMLAATAGFCMATAFRIPPLNASLNMIDASAFNVLLHGLFVLDIMTSKNQIHISSPKCSDMDSYPHRYRAGSWKKDFSNFQTELKGNLTTTWNPGNPKPDLTEAPNLKDHMKKPDHTKAYFSITLPFPQKIKGLRAFTDAEVYYPSCCMTGKIFPLVLALSYQSPPSAPLISESGIYWDPSKNFHIFAEPEDLMDCEEAEIHGRETMRRLWSMFAIGPDSVGPIPRNGCNKNPDPQPTASGVIKDEELSLSELNLFSSGKESIEGVHLPMCATLIAP